MMMCRFFSRRATIVRAAVGVAAGLCLAAFSVHAINVIDEFDGAALDTTKWQQLGGKTYTMAGGKLVWNADSGNWGDGEIGSVTKFYLPPAGQTTTITWELGPGLITLENPGDGGQSIRWQIGIFSANETAGSLQHWSNSTGGVWVDVDNVRNTDKNGVTGGLYFTNDTKAADSQGLWLTGLAITDWAWETQNRTFRLEITETGLTWYDGATVLVNVNWADLSIDTEFANGYRIMALGMNYNAGRGTTSYERIAIENGYLGSALISSFTVRPSTITSGQSARLSWIIDPAASASIDQGIGNVDGLTTNGEGSASVTGAEVTEPTQVLYTLTVTKGAETATRQLAITVVPRPELVYDDFVEDFLGAALDPELWEYRGGKTHTVADSMVKWNDDGGNWDHGEVDSTYVFPMPASGQTTTIKWTLGPGSITTQNPNAAQSIRYIVGIFSYYERHGWSRQAWQNTTGGVWMDIDNIANARTDGVSGGLIHCNDTKPVDTGGTWHAGFDIPNWNWQTESHEVTLVISDAGYSWFNGEELLGTASWEQAGLDTEFSNGFKLMAGGLNFDSGRGFTSIDKIELKNGGAPAQFEITSIASAPGGVDLTWESEAGFTYDVLRAADPAGPWQALATGLPGQAGLTAYKDSSVPAGAAFYQVQQLPPPPLFWFDFEPGEDLSGWQQIVEKGTTRWQSGQPTSGPGAAHSGVNVYATNLAGDYDSQSTVSLRTPVIDLTGLPMATLSYYQWFNIEQDFDWGYVNVLDAGGNDLLGLPLIEVTGQSGTWQRKRVQLPAEALGKQIIIEFKLDTDSIGVGAGWYLDEVSVY